MESVSANRMQPRVGFFKVNWSAFKINTKSCLRSSIINRKKAWAEKLQTIPFVALFLTSVQLSLCPAWIELLKAAAVPSQMSGECLAHGESFHEWISTFRMPNIWKPFIFKFTCQDISSGLCVYGWPTMALPAPIKQCKNTALRSAVGRQLLASPTWNPETSFAVWSGHQAFWFNWDYKLHGSLEFKPYLYEGENAKDVQWCITETIRQVGLYCPWAVEAHVGWCVTVWKDWNGAWVGTKNSFFYKFNCLFFLFMGNEHVEVCRSSCHWLEKALWLHVRGWLALIYSDQKCIWSSTDTDLHLSVFRTQIWCVLQHVGFLLKKCLFVPPTHGSAPVL